MASADAEHLEQRVARLEQQEDRLTRAVELLAQREAAPARRPRRDWDGLAAVIASFIGLLALAISGYTAYVQREQLRAQGEQLRAQVWPRLAIDYTNNDPDLSWHVYNHGTGPALVVAMRVVVGDALVTSWGAARDAAGYVDGELTTTSSITESVLPAGKDVAMIRAGDDPQSQTRFRGLLSGRKHALRVMICYCSVLNDCWVTTEQARPSIEPSPPGSCPIKPAEQFKD